MEGLGGIKISTGGDSWRHGQINVKNDKAGHIPMVGRRTMPTILLILGYCNINKLVNGDFLGCLNPGLRKEDDGGEL